MNVSKKINILMQVYLEKSLYLNRLAIKKLTKLTHRVYDGQRRLYGVGST